MIRSNKQSDQSSSKESSVYKEITISKEYDKESDKTEESEESRKPIRIIQWMQDIIIIIKQELLLLDIEILIKFDNF